MNVMRHLPGIRALVQLMAWLWEPMAFTDPFANRVRPGLLSRTATPCTPQRRLRLPPRPAAPRPSPYRALALTE